MNFYKSGKYFENGKINLDLLDNLADKIYEEEKWKNLTKSIFRQCNNEVIAGHSNIDSNTNACSSRIFQFDDCFIENVVIVSLTR